MVFHKTEGAGDSKSDQNRSRQAGTQGCSQQSLQPAVLGAASGSCCPPELRRGSRSQSRAGSEPRALAYSEAATNCCGSGFQDTPGSTLPEFSIYPKDNAWEEMCFQHALAFHVVSLGLCVQGGGPFQAA